MLDIRLLKYFLAVAKEKNITKAAEMLHITQPTLSRQLMQMENDLNTKLFIRNKRKIILTNEGLLLRRRAEDIIELADKTERDLLERNEQLDGTITIGSGNLEVLNLMADIVSSFKEKYPLVKFNIYTANADTVKERMDRDLIDIGILLEPISKDGYEFIRTPVKEEWVVVMRADDPLTKKENIRIEDLIDKPIIFPSRTSIQTELANYFNKDFEKLQIQFTSNFSTNSAVFVEHRLGYALTLRGALPYMDKNILCCRPLSPKFEAATVFAWKRQQPFVLAVMKFIEHMQSVLS